MYADTGHECDFPVRVTPMTFLIYSLVLELILYLEFISGALVIILISPAPSNKYFSWKWWSCIRLGKKDWFWNTEQESEYTALIFVATVSECTTCIFTLILWAVVLGSADESVTVSDLTPCTYYIFKVRAHTQFGGGPWMETEVKTAANGTKKFTKRGSYPVLNTAVEQPVVYL